MKVGLYGIGLDVYWPQFSGLQDKLAGYQNVIAEKMSSMEDGVEIVNAGIVDTPQKARETGMMLKSENVEAVFLFISTYALSSTVLPVVQELKVPVVVLSIQPDLTIDYKTFNSLGDRGKMTGEWLAFCQACSAPEIAGVFNRAGISYHLVTGALNDEDTWTEIAGWLSAVTTVSRLKNTRIGLLGHYYGGMLDVYSDLTNLSSVFGCHFEMREPGELLKNRSEASPEQISEKLASFNTEFDVDTACSDYELERAAATSVALDTLVEDHELGALAYYFEGSGDERLEDIITSVIPGNTLLTKRGIPVAGEYEVKNVIAMKIMDTLGCGGSFSEFYTMDLKDDIVMLGHDGPGHPEIAEGRVRLVPLPVYHGKPGKGLSIQMSVKHGDVTLLSVVEKAGGKVMLLTAEGESVEGPVLNIGNTNSRYRFSLGAKEFVKRWSEQGPSHHMAIGTGHVADKIEKIAKVLNIEYCKVC